MKNVITVLTKSFMSISMALLVHEAKATPATCSTPADCQTVATQQSRRFLPAWISENSRNCDLLHPIQSDSHANSDCRQKIVSFANSALTCEHNTSYLVEMTAYDSELLKWKIKDNGGEAIVPDAVNQVFAKLVETASRNFKFEMKNPEWSLSAYKSKFANAHAGANGEIMMTDIFFQEGSGFDMNDITAFLAHEVSHVIQRHSLRQGCMAIEGALQPHLGIAEASGAVLEDSNPTSQRVQIWTQLSQKFEFEADLQAKTLLRLSGFDPSTMAIALEKLKPKDAGGFSRGSHPTIDKRVESLLK